MQVRGGPSKASAIRDVTGMGARTGMEPVPPNDRAHPEPTPASYPIPTTWTDALWGHSWVPKDRIAGALVPLRSTAPRDAFGCASLVSTSPVSRRSIPLTPSLTLPRPGEENRRST